MALEYVLYAARARRSAIDMLLGTNTNTEQYSSKSLLDVLAVLQSYLDSHIVVIVHLLLIFFNCDYFRDCH